MEENKDRSQILSKYSHRAEKLTNLYTGPPGRVAQPNEYIHIHIQ